MTLCGWSVRSSAPGPALPTEVRPGLVDRSGGRPMQRGEFTIAAADGEDWELILASVLRGAVLMLCAPSGRSHPIALADPSAALARGGAQLLCVSWTSSDTEAFAHPDREPGGSPGERRAARPDPWSDPWSDRHTR